MRHDHIRRCVFRPYRKGMGPVFTLDMYDTGRPARPGASQWGVAYRLHMRTPDGQSVLLFDGDDYGCSPMHAIDSDESVGGLMKFLCLRPGDVEDDWFEGYSPAAMDFAEAYADALDCEVRYRFGWDD